MELTLEPIEKDRAAAAPAAPKNEIATAAAKAIDLSKLNLTDVALAQFGDWEAQVKAAEDKFTDTVFDVSTTTKLAEVKSLRERLVNQPRAEARKVAKAIKSKLSTVSGEVGDRLEKIVAEFDRVQKLIDEPINKREAELERERERKETLNNAIQTIAAYVDQAKGLPSAKIQEGITALEAMTFGDEWQEFKDAAIDTHRATIDALRSMFLDALAEEDRKAEEERKAQTVRLLADLQQQVFGCMGKPAAYIADQLDLLRNTTYDPDVDETVTLALAQSRAQVEQMLVLAQQSEQRLAEESAAKKKADEALVALAPIAPPAVEPPAPTVGELQEPAADEPVAILGGAEVVMSATPGVPAVKAVDPADTSIETSEADAIEPPLGAIPVADTHAGTDPVGVIRDAASLVAFLNAELNGKFKSHPKPSADWWATLRVMADNLGPRLTVLAEMFGDES